MSPNKQKRNIILYNVIFFFVGCLITYIIMINYTKTITYLHFLFSDAKVMYIIKCANLFCIIEFQNCNKKLHRTDELK